MNHKHSSKHSRGFGSRRTHLSRSINRRASFEPLETRQLLSVTLPDIGPQLVRAGAPLNLALHATGTAASDPISYTVTVNNSSSANPNLTYTIPANNKFLDLHVTYAGDPSTTSDDFSGDMIFELYNDLAPNAVQNITQLVNAGYYTGLDFHRVLETFMIQGGGYQASNGVYRDPTKTPYNITPYANEISNNLKFTSSGVLALANTGAASSNTSQFFVTSGPQRFLDGGYTIFGFLVQGEDIRQKIASVPVHLVSGGVDSQASTPDYTIKIDTASIITDTSDAVLRLAAVAASTGSAEVSVTATDTISNETVTKTFHVDVSPDTATATDNIAPVLTPSSTFPVLATVKKNAVPVNVSISSIINNGSGTTTISDDPGAIVGGVAITSVTGLGTWKYSLDGTTFTTIDKTTLSKSNALLLPKDAKLQYTPDGSDSEKANVTYSAWDTTTGTAGGTADISQNSATGDTTAFSTISDTAWLYVNDAPVLTAAAPVMGTTDESTQIVISISGTNSFINNGDGTTIITDPDANDATRLGGIVITGVTGNGVWEYALLSSPNTFHTIDKTINASNALILAKSGSKLRYTPDGLNGETATITYHAWDTFSGTNGKPADLTKTGSTGGSSSFSAASDTAKLIVTPVNDAPVLTPAVPTPVVIGRAASNSPSVIPLSSFITADQNKTTETIIQDVDSGAVIGGIAVAGITGNGTWEYSTDNGVNFHPIPAAISASSALLLSKDAQLRYTPGTDNSVAATITYYAWDTSDGKTSGDTVNISQATSLGGTTAYSLVTDTGEIVVNNAPILTPTAPTLPSTDENTPRTFALTDFLGTSISDSDPSAVIGGIAITHFNSGIKGTWAYTLDGTTFTNINASAVSESAALLLPSNAKLRFTPDNKNGEITSFTYRAWDTTSGTAGGTLNLSASGATGGASAFSSDTDTATLTVTSVNDAPVLTPANPILGSTKNTAPKAVNLVDFINHNSGTAITDADDKDKDAVGGIAVVGITGAGKWEYTLDGTTFIAITDVAEANALLLPKDAILRYTPLNTVDVETATIKYHAWDVTTGTAETKVDLTPAADATGGITAFSTATDTATIYVNDAPVLTVANPTLGTVANTGPTTIVVGSFINSGAGTTTISDPNQTPYTGGIALIGVTGGGTWAYSLDNGLTFHNIESTISGSKALLLPNNAKLRYTPTGTTSEKPTITYIAWDQTTGIAGDRPNLTATGGATAYSDLANPDKATLNVRSAPTDISLDNKKVNDNAAIGTKVGSLSTTASDSDGIQFTYELVPISGSTDDTYFTISGNELKTSKTFNTDNTGSKGSYTIRVRTKDPIGLVFEKSFTIALTDVTKPTVKIEQQAGQADPTHSGAIYFVVTFSEPVTDFNINNAAYVTLSGTAPGAKVQKITGSGKNYEVQVGGMTGSGTVIASITAGKAHDAGGNTNLASTSDDNTVTYTYNWANYMGTSRDDTFVFSPGATAGTWQVMCNSTIWTIPAGTQGITIDGLGGNDTIKVVGTAGSQNLQISSDGGKFMAGNFEIDFAHFESYALGDLFCTLATATHTYDTIQMYGVAGSAGGKTFTASPTAATLSLNGYSINATNFANVQAYIEQGNNNTATFTDSDGNDLYLISYMGADMMYRGNNTEVSAWGFGNTNATSAKGTDEVRFYGKPGATDSFTASASEATYTNPGFVNKASGFKDMQAYIDPNNDCTATLIGTAATTSTTGNDRAVTSPLGAQLFATGFKSSAWNFKHVNIQGNGGTDSADMYGYYPGEVNPLKNTIVGDSQSVTQSGGSATSTYNNSLSGFTTINVLRNPKTVDSVTLDNVTFNANDLPLGGSNQYKHKLVFGLEAKPDNPSDPVKLDELFTTTNKANPTPQAIDQVMKGYWE